MQATQWSEIQARYRRFLRTVGQQTLAADEVISPGLQLEQLHVAPWRSDPVAFMGFADADGAAQRNQVALRLNGGNTAAPVLACALVRRVHVSLGESAAAGLFFFRLWVSGSSAITLTASLTQPVKVEPVTGSVGVVPQPVALGVLVIGTGNELAIPADAIEIGRRVGVGATTIPEAEFELDPPVLLASSGVSTTSIRPPSLIGVTADTTDGVNPVRVSACFSGELFQLYPPR